MTDAELLLVEEVVTRLRDGLPIHDIAPALDPSLVELATALAGEMSEVGWVAGQAVPTGFDAVWHSVAALGGVGASGAVAATLGGAGGAAAGAGGSVTSGTALAGGGLTTGGAASGGFGGAITSIIGGIGGTAAAVAGSAVVASAVVAAVIFSTPSEVPPPDDTPILTAPDVPDAESPDQPSPVPPDEPDAADPDTSDEPSDETGDPADDAAAPDETEGTPDDTSGDAPDSGEPPAETGSPPAAEAPPVEPAPDPAPDPVGPAPSQPEPEPAPPVARDEAVTVVSRVATTIDVLANDAGPEVPLDVSTLKVVGRPSHGAATISGNKITYRSDRLWLGADRFTYRICDRDGRCAQAKVTATTTRRVESSEHVLPGPQPLYSFSLGSNRDPDSADFVELAGGRVDRLDHDQWRWLGPPGQVAYPVAIRIHVANTDGSLSELRMALLRSVGNGKGNGNGK